MQIMKKIAQSAALVGQVIDSLSSNSDTDAPSIRVVNEALEEVISVVNEVSSNGIRTVKFSNGLMIQKGNISKTLASDGVTSESDIITFTEPFTTIIDFHITNIYFNSNKVIWSVGEVKADAINVYFYITDNGVSPTKKNWSIEGQWTAIGLWK